jgi:hypothetical protein
MKSEIITAFQYPERFRVLAPGKQKKAFELTQRAIENMSFYKFCYKPETECNLDQMRVLLARMKPYQLQHDEYTDDLVAGISDFYLSRLKTLYLSKDLTASEERDQCIFLIDEWEAEQMPLLNYPKQIVMEDGRIMRICFDFHLVYTICGRNLNETVNALLEMYSGDEHTKCKRKGQYPKMYAR